MQTYDSSLAPRFSQALAQREAELSVILSAASGYGEELAQAGARDVSDFKDMATEETQATVDEAKAEHAAYELEQVLAAQRRLTDGSFGQCLDCGEPIDLRRLTALPATPFCTACQALREQGAARR